MKGLGGDIGQRWRRCQRRCVRAFRRSMLEQALWRHMCEPRQPCMACGYRHGE